MSLHTMPHLIEHNNPKASLRATDIRNYFRVCDFTWVSIGNLNANTVYHYLCGSLPARTLVMSLC